MSWEERGAAVVTKLMKDLGITSAQAGGIVGNLGFESIGFTALHEIGQPEGQGGYGWAQWTGPRRDSFFDWCKIYHYDWHSDEGNYSYLLHELRTTHKQSLSALRKTTTLEAAVFTFGYYFEAPGGTTPDHLPGYEGRLDYARRALAGFTVPANEPSRIDLLPAAITTFNAAATLLQMALKDARFYNGKVDGDWGPASRAALLAYTGIKK